MFAGLCLRYNLDAMDSSLPWVRQNLRYDSVWWRQLAYFGCVYGPEWWKHSSPPAIAAMIFMLASASRRGATSNMQRILGTATRSRVQRAALRMFAEFAHCFTETMEAYGPRPQPLRIDVTGRDELARVLHSGRGAVLVTAHLGNWEVAARELRAFGRPVNVVMAHEANTTANAYVQRQVQEHAGVRVIYSDASVFSSLNILQALRRNEVVAIQLDRSMHADGTRLLPFFGLPAAFPSGPFVLARAAGAPLIPVFAPRLGPRHYALRVCGRFEVAREARDSRALTRVMSDVIQIFEATVREFPTQWFQFKSFWNEDALPCETALCTTSGPLTERLGAWR